MNWDFLTKGVHSRGFCDDEGAETMRRKRWRPWILVKGSSLHRLVPFALPLTLIVSHSHPCNAHKIMATKISFCKKKPFTGSWLKHLWTSWWTFRTFFSLCGGRGYREKEASEAGGGVGCDWKLDHGWRRDFRAGSCGWEGLSLHALSKDPL